MAAFTTGFGKMTYASLRYPTLVLYMIGLLTQSATAEENDYLSEISAEVKKIDVKLTTQGEQQLNQDGLTDKSDA
jgi:hypothetical protein